MMKKVIIFVSFLVVLASCDISDEDEDKFGFVFTVTNNLSAEHDNAKITIGGMKDGKFVGTESYTFPKLLTTQYHGWYQWVAHNERWNPNLDLIRAIPSEKAYFSIQLEGKEEIVLYDSWEKHQGDLVNIAIPKGTIIKNDDGHLSISIGENNVLAHLHSDRDTLP